MFKYVLKRLGLSVIVLLGVSIIIYFLVRLMPTDYLENKFSAQIQQGTITIEQLDDFKKRYGLYMPEAYLTLDRDGITYEKDAKESRCLWKDVRVYQAFDSMGNQIASEDKVGIATRVNLLMEEKYVAEFYSKMEEDRILLVVGK